MSGLLALLDDVAAIAKVAAASVDDIAGAAAKAGAKAAGVVIDDAAVTPKYVHGFEAARELPIIWRIARGSVFNKIVLLLPGLLALNYFAPWAITPLLMLGGAFLCFEGAEKLAHRFLHAAHEDEAHHEEQVRALSNPATDMVSFERDKIKGAVRTDFILSAEIIAITLGTVATADFSRQVVVLCTIAIAMTVGVYGLVGGIVKLDDLGLYLSRKVGSFAQACGNGILWLAPYLMKTLSVVGTAAMFLVGGSIIGHGVAAIHHGIDGLAQRSGGFAWAVSLLGDAVVGVVTGAVVLGVVTAIQRIRKGVKAA